jgi:hypothetical protein
MVGDGPHTARTPRLTMRVLRSCRPAARWRGPVWFARPGGRTLTPLGASFFGHQTSFSCQSERKTPPGSGVPSRQRGTSVAGGRRREAGSRMTHAGRERKISCRSNPGRNMGFQIYGYCPTRLMETQFRCRIGQRRVDTRDGGMYRTRYHRHKAPRPAQTDRCCPVSVITEDAIGMLKLA